MSTLEAFPIRPAEAPTRRFGALVSAWAVPLGVAMMWMLLIWSVHREGPRTLISFHGLLHAAIVEQFLGSDNAFAPPDNPFFAGHPVAYYWFFHWLAAQLVRLFGLNVFHAMEVLILFAVGTLSIVAIDLGRRLFGSTLSGGLIGYLILAGTNPLGIVFAVYKVARNGVHVLNDDPNYLWGVVHPLYSMIRYNDFGGLYGPLLNFFLNITSRPLALAGVLVVVLCLYRALNKHRLSSWLWLSLAVGFTTAFSPIVGLAVGGALTMALVSAWLLGRRLFGIADSSVGFTTVRSAGLAVVGGALLAAPTYYHLILGPSSSKAEFWLFSGPGLRHLLTVTLSILPLVVISLLGLRRAAENRKQFLTILLVSGLLLLLLTVGFTLPAGNQSNLFHAATVLLAVVAGGAISHRGLGRDAYGTSERRAAVIALIFLPTLGGLLSAYLYRPPVAVSFENVHIERLPHDSNLPLLYEWVRNETDAKSVFVIDPRDRVAMCGNTAEFPAMTGRSVFTEHFRHYLVEPYPDSKVRFDMAVRLVSGGELDGSDRGYVARLNRPVFIVSDLSEGGAQMDRMIQRYGPPAFQHGQISVYKWSDEHSASIPDEGNSRLDEWQRSSL